MYRTMMRRCCSGADATDEPDDVDDVRGRGVEDEVLRARLGARR